MKRTEWCAEDELGSRPIAGIPASRAMICVNCDVVGSPDRRGNCTHCGSAVVIEVEKALLGKGLERITRQHLLLLTVLEPLLADEKTAADGNEKGQGLRKVDRF